MINFNIKYTERIPKAYFCISIKFTILDLTLLHQLTQEIIDAIGSKQPVAAKKKIEIAKRFLNGLADTALTDSELIELSKYEALINLLNNKLK